jgi:hypothetical protein
MPTEGSDGAIRTRVALSEIAARLVELVEGEGAVEADDAIA